MIRLVRNTAINFGAYGAISVVNILIIPVIVAHYGVDKFGLLVLARLMLPAGFMAVFDLGLPEATTRFVASAKAESDLPRAGRIVMQNLCMATGIGIVVAIAIGSAAPVVIGSGFRLDTATAESFYPVLLATALALILVYPGMIAEAALKGLQHFGVVRAGEVAAVLLYAGGTLFAIGLGFGYQALAYLYLGLTSLKLMAFAAVLLTSRHGVRIGIGTDGRTTLAETLSLARPVWLGKIMSVAGLYAPQLLIANLAGPAAVGTYDVLTRLPRLAKTVYSLTNSALLPTSADLDTRQDSERMRQLLLKGTTFSLALFVPPIAGAGVYAADILRVWLGPDYADLGPWLTLFFCWTMVIAFYAFGSSMLVARSDAVRKGNRIYMVELAILYAVAVLAFGRFQELAFILGTTVAAALVLPFRIRLVCREYVIGFWRYVAIPGRLAAAGIVAALWWFVADRIIAGDGLASLLGAFGGWCIVYWLAIYALAFSTEDRRHVQKMIANLSPRLQTDR